MKRVISVVTGAGGTLGSAVCKHLCEQQHEVIGIIRPGGTIPSGHERMKLLEVDLEQSCTLSELSRGLETIVDFSRVERLNIIHTAGVYRKCSLPYTADELLTWEQMFQVHCMSLAAIVSALFPYFVACRQGSIVAVSSNLVHRVNRHSAPYIATKGALEALIRQWAYDLGPYQIRCNCIAPGYFQSELNPDIGSEQEERIQSNTPLGSIATGEQIEAAIYAFVTDSMNWVTGQTIIVDGGNSIGY
ncbi:SDR family NAD(P)-dependent oxidoreductase [Paenibacillus massiliensis]|uniref:SDR family NAD(P)-dependent oxidoreductase n=1 Tax=Paenibacillus massiliensis TaxID=225917 RepID=UPI0004729E5B|nr:SDR family oxidoreductase [Paenibacillus massiliensis]